MQISNIIVVFLIEIEIIEITPANKTGNIENEIKNTFKNLEIFILNKVIYNL